MDNRRGGTALAGVSLWQVLAVLGILGVVAAVLFPILARPGCDCARQPSCASNEKQIGIALLSYVQDADNRLPPPFLGGVQGWAGRVNPYIKSSGLYHCPNDPAVADKTLTQPTSYAYNSNLVEGDAGFNPANATNPSVTVAVFEVSGAKAAMTEDDEETDNWTKAPASGYLSPAGNGTGDPPRWGWVGSGPNPIRYATGSIGGRGGFAGKARHDGGANYLALDGHVKWCKPDRISGGMTNPSPKGAQDVPPGAAAGTESGRCELTFSAR